MINDTEELTDITIKLINKALFIIRSLKLPEFFFPFFHALWNYPPPLWNYPPPKLAQPPFPSPAPTPNISFQTYRPTVGKCAEWKVISWPARGCLDRSKETYYKARCFLIGPSVKTCTICCKHWWVHAKCEIWSLGKLMILDHLVTHIIGMTGVWNRETIRPQTIRRQDPSGGISLSYWSPSF